ncbi:GntR family transcriptional regulator, partial [Escherichia coli]
MKKQAVFQEVAYKIAQRVNDGTYVTSQKLPSDYD